MNTLINNLLNDMTSYPKQKSNDRIKDSGDVYSAEFEKHFCFKFFKNS